MSCAYVFIATITALALVGLVWDMARTIKETKNTTRRSRMPTEGEVLFQAGYHYAFARFMESGRFEARPFNPAALLTADPFREQHLWKNQFQARYGVDENEINGDKVLERIGAFNLTDPNPIWKAWCDAQGVPMDWQAYMDTRFVAKRGKTADGEDYITAWDDWISKTPIPGEGGNGQGGSEELERLRAELKSAKDETRNAQNVAAGLKLKLEGVQAALAKVKIKESGGGVPMSVLREIKAVVR